MTRSLDHFIILVRNLDTAITVYQRLGFNARPAAQHVEIGSRNSVVIFDHTYLELLDLTTTRSQAVKDDYLGRFVAGEGITHVALTSAKLEPDMDSLASQGVQVGTLLNARRKIRMPSGEDDETASRSVYFWRDHNRYLSLFLSDHPKPHTIFIPEYNNHANSARRVVRLAYMSRDPLADIPYFRTLFGAEPTAVSADGFSMTGARGDVTDVLTVEAAQRRYGPFLTVQGLSTLAGVGIAFHYKVESLAECESYFQRTGVLHERRNGKVFVPASEGCGAISVFES